MIARFALAALVALLASRGVADDKHSGYQDASPETRAMQDDDAANPAFLWVQQGEALWSERAGSAGRSCADCHADAPARCAAWRRAIRSSMRRSADRSRSGNVSSSAASNGRARRRCRRTAMRCSALPRMSACNRAGYRCRYPSTVPLRPFFEAGKALFTMRQGQLNLSCNQCHDGLAGQRLAGSVIPQGHPNGYPEYRLEWQGMGSLERRIRNCLVGVRAEPFAPDAPELTALALYLGWRANGLPVETPAVRP